MAASGRGESPAAWQAVSFPASRRMLRIAASPTGSLHDPHRPRHRPRPVPRHRHAVRRGRGAPPTRTAVPPIVYKQRTLANGLKVYTSLDRTTPNVTVQVWYGVGSKDDPQGRSGFAHLFEHLMFKATRDLPAESFDRLTEDVGGFNNASTYDDFTNYYEVVPGQPPGAAALGRGRAHGLAGRRRGQLQVRARRGEGGAAPAGAGLALRPALRPLPAAGHATRPTPTSARASARSRSWTPPPSTTCAPSTQAYYRPDNAALIVVGNFDEAQLDAWIDKYFGPLKNPAERRSSG